MSKFILNLFIFCVVSTQYCWALFRNDAKIVSIPFENSYFGYSLLLQKFNNGGQVIVGAPGHSSTKQGGSLYRCNFPSGACSRIRIPVNNLTEGNWLGSVLDGQTSGNKKIFTCAPRQIRKENDYYMNGLCYEVSSRGMVQEIHPLGSREQVSGQITSLYNNNSYGELGLSIHYSEDTEELVMGAVGILQWSGSIFVRRPKDTLWLPYKIKGPTFSETQLYLGYSVYSAKFNSKSPEIWYVAGSPRSRGLYGEVKIFTFDLGMKEHIRMISSNSGKEFAAYFGASILIEDLNGDGRKDLLVGAPMGADSTWDEGHVFVYRLLSPTRFSDSPVKLTGSRKTSGRFGSAMASLGDVDLDGFNDIAISAPYENEGVGAVYIYKGSKDFIEDSYKQKLTPKLLEYQVPRKVRAFGLGLSKGCDINNDGYNDLAIGAYKSDLVFVLTSKQVVDFTLSASSSMEILDAGEFSITYCLTFRQRKASGRKLTLNFRLSFDIDGRGTVLGSLPHSILVEEDKQNCQFAHIKFKYDRNNAQAFHFGFSAKLNSENITAVGKKYELLVPVPHECGSDKICEPEIEIEFFEKLSNVVIVGLNKTVEVNLTLDNTGEAAYQCRLEIEAPEGLSLRNTMGCVVKDSIYDCPVMDKFDNIINMTLVFDVDNPNTEWDELIVNFVVRSGNYSISKSFTFKTLLINSPFIEGDSNVQTIEYSDDLVEVVHRFSILNLGISPLKLQVYLFIPRIPLKEQEGSFIDIVSVESSHNNMLTSCQAISNSLFNFTTTKPESTQPLNRSELINCFGAQSNCRKFFCDGMYLMGSSESANYHIKMLVNMKGLAKFFASQFEAKDILVFSTTALISNATDTIEGHASTVLFFPMSRPIPLWIYIVSILGGFLLLLLIIFLLYKCHFFKRDLRDKLAEEQQSLDSKEPNELQEMNTES